MKKIALNILLAVSLCTPDSLHADENLFGFVYGAETLPAGHTDVYQFMTLRTGKDAGGYYGWDFETEVEYGFTDRFQGSISIENRYIRNKNVPGLDDTSHFTFGGVAATGKYRILSPFKDGIGLALRLEGGFVYHDEVDGLLEHDVYIAPTVILQKNFLDDTLVAELNLGTEWAWGKDPAEQYYKEFAAQGGFGISYRFARNWSAGVETHFRAEWPMFNLFHNFEHVVVYAGPTVHYAGKKWWATLNYDYQVYGTGVDEISAHQTFAEETRHVFRLKVGFNF